MHKVIVFAACVLFSVGSIAQTDLIYPELDKSFIKLWHYSSVRDAKASKLAFDNFNSEWKNVKKKLLKKNTSDASLNTFASEMEDYITLMSSSIEESNLSSLDGAIYDAILSWRSLRKSKGKDQYSLDKLWQVYDQYCEIDFTISDPMLNLKSWFEFEKDVEKFNELWATYEEVPWEEIQQHFPGITQKEHSYHKQILNQCLDDFIGSLESAYRLDFEMPCEEIGVSINNLIFFYSR